MKKKKKSKKSRFTQMNPITFGNFLRRIHLGGNLEECVIKITNGIAEVAAVDISNSLYLHCQEDIPIIGNHEVGITDLGIMCKLFSNEDRKISMGFEKNKLIVSYQKHGTIRLALADPDTIPTTVVTEDGVRMYKTYQKIIKDVVNEVKITKEVVNDYKHISTLLKTKGVVIKVNNGKVFLTSAPLEANTFKITVGNTEFKGSLSKELYSKYFTSIMDILDFENPDVVPKILFSEKTEPIVICQDKYNLWSLLPACEDISSQEEEQGIPF